MIKILDYKKLSQEIKNELEYYIFNEFGEIPIVKETDWAEPNWTIVYSSEGQIVSFYNIVERKVSIDHKFYKCGGINNVITPSKYRGKGFATKMLNDTSNFLFENLKCDIGLLLCADELVPFYEKLNWYKVNCPVYFFQKSSKKIWGANTMLLSRGKRVHPKNIDLNGYPW